MRAGDMDRRQATVAAADRRRVLHGAAAMSAVAAVDPRGQVHGSYPPRSIKRQRRTASAVEQLERRIRAILEEDHPQSIRHCFYRLTDPRLPEPVEKSERAYRQVQTRITLLRRAERLPYGWISD